MFARLVCTTAAVAVALLAAPALFAKEDVAAEKAARDAVIKEYKAAKKYVFSDLVYFIDSTKLKDQRWTFKDIDFDDKVMNRGEADFPSGNAADTSSSVSVLFLAGLHSKTEAGKKSEFSIEFKSYGKSVKTSDIAGLADGYYNEFLKSATDIVKEKCHPPDKKAPGPAKYWAWAVGTDKEVAKRVRKDWFLWPTNTKTGAWTYIVVATTADKFIDIKDWGEKLEDLVKNIQELKDARLK